jgi:hypothetical protein
MRRHNRQPMMPPVMSGWRPIRSTTPGAKEVGEDAADDPAALEDELVAGPKTESFVEVLALGMLAGKLGLEGGSYVVVHYIAVS